MTASPSITGSIEMPCSRWSTSASGTCAASASPRPGEPIGDRLPPVRRDARRLRAGEGAGVAVLEDLEHAKARGARSTPRPSAYGSAADGWNMIEPIENGDRLGARDETALDRRGPPADEAT